MNRMIPKASASRVVASALNRSHQSFLPFARFGLNTARSFSDACADVKARQPARPSIADAKDMVRHPSEMPNDLLLKLAYGGDADACKERLIREIMSVDNVEWEEGNKIMLKMKQDNKTGMALVRLPYKAGLYTSVFAGVVSLPMVFSLDLALWFNTDYVTTDVPEPRDLETFLEVGSWTWNWMEPPLGTISFVLLALQFARNQMTNLGWQPYTQRVQRARAISLHNLYPNYDKDIVARFAIGDGWK